MDKEIIRKNFSRYAPYYDRYASVQDYCGFRLLSKIEKDGFGKILDIGCGTGNYTKLLKERFPHSSIKAIDISKDMIKIAKEKLKKKGVEFIIADGETIDLKERFDLISSNAAFQWFDNLKGTLTKYKEIITKKGLISFSIFGPQTFNELSWSLKRVFNKDISLSSCNFIEAKSIIKILSRLFRKVKIEKEIYKEDHKSLKELFEKIRYTGIRGNGVNNINLWTPNILSELEKIYKKRFKGITATYQIFFCKAMK